MIKKCKLEISRQSNIGLSLFLTNTHKHNYADKNSHKLLAKCPPFNLKSSRNIKKMRQIKIVTQTLR